jgi:hypothetical protein
MSVRPSPPPRADVAIVPLGRLPRLQMNVELVMARDQAFQQFKLAMLAA